MKGYAEFTAKTKSTNPYAPTSNVDIEQQTPTSYITGALQGARNFVLGRPEPEPQGWLSVFNFLPNDKNYIGAIVAFGIAAFFIFLCVLLAPEIMLMPAKFVMCFTFAMISLISAIAMLSGPRLYIKKLFLAKNLYATILLIFSIVMALWFSTITKSYIWSLVFCACELNSVAFYFCQS